ncbi:MAG TPA: DUF1236 domain-containing protein [Bradyrhizobium sp.]|nr:DUF1236 domain-containing protein [Bradyrhizobium sp.]
MNNRFLISVAAAALIAGTGFANAQGSGTGRESPPSATTQQNPSSGASNRDSSQSGAPAEAPKSAQSKDSEGSKNQRAQDNNMQGQKSKSMSSDSQKSAPAKDMKAEDRNSNTNRAEDRNNNNSNTNRAEDRNNNNMNRAEDRNRAGTSTTTGQAGAGAKLSGEQRTKITTVIRSQHVQPVTNVNFSISVGTRVPRNVGFHPLPAEIITIYPEWRGYEFFLVGNQIVVVNPRTLEIVDVIDA